MGNQTALVAGSLIRMNNAFAGHTVDDRGGELQGRQSVFLVARGNRGDDFLDIGA